MYNVRARLFYFVFLHIFIYRTYITTLYNVLPDLFPEILDHQFHAHPITHISTRYVSIIGVTTN